MHTFFAFIIALFLTIVLTPLLARVAGWLHVVDIPDVRKVHNRPIPRCGGIAIAVATLVPVYMWAEFDHQARGCLVAAALVLIIGLCDDVRPVHYGWRLLGQATAALIVVASGVVFECLPFFGLDPAPVWLTYPLTALFLVGLTNAVNLFDGLDGLAGGCVLMTLSAITILAYQSDAQSLQITSVAIIGAIFGFLRYNTHPANVFMGDAGSNWLGFTVGILCILLLQRHDTALNPALPTLLVGVPLLDLLVVVTQRMLNGQSPFAADRRHLHHKVLDLGFHHYEAVALIYVVQAVMVSGALALRYHSDAAFFGVWITCGALVLLPLLMLHMRGWKRARGANLIAALQASHLYARLPAIGIGMLTSGLTMYILAGALAPVDISSDVAVLAAGAAGLLLADLVLLRQSSNALARIGVYVAAAAVAHFFVVWYEHSKTVELAVGMLLACMGAILVAAIIVSSRDGFRITPQDLLILMLAIVVPNLTGRSFIDYQVGQMAVMLVVVFYAAEFLLSRDRRVPLAIRLASIAGLGIIGIRGFLA
jgi:UDP-GlcNAc:undecaprenyl-phosphate GlcNAc-1-phosphate transferase